MSKEEPRYVQIAKPCLQPWEAMTGDERVRECHQCRLNVYNLSVMSSDEATELINNTEGRLCVRFFQRPDGTVLTADCTTQRPEGFWPRILRWFGVRQPPASPPQPSAPQAERGVLMGHFVRERELPVVVLCAAKTILANEQITPDAIQSTTIRRCDSVENMAERVEEVCGRRTRKTIRRGEKILLADLVQAEEAEVDQSC